MTNRSDLRIAYASDLYMFVELVFSLINPSTKFLPNWHLQLMSDCLTRCSSGEIKRLIINMPPRHMKSTVTTIAFPAWLLIRNPHLKIMVICYGEELVKEFRAQFRRLIQNPLLQSHYPHLRLDPTASSADTIQLAAGGSWLGVSIDGPITGRGADMIIIDDPIKAQDIRTRELSNVTEKFALSVSQRLNNPNKGAIILVMQRLHVDDLTGHLLRGYEHWEHLKLPAIATDDERYVLSSGEKLFRSAGEALHPEFYSLENLQKRRANDPRAIFEAQYQQEPTIDDSAIVHPDWFDYCEPHQIPKEYDLILQSWDTASKTTDQASFSVGLTFGVLDDHYYLLDEARGKFEFTDLKNLIRATAESWNARVVLIEDAASGTQLISALKSEDFNTVPITPSRDKVSRLEGISHIVKEGRVHLPKVRFLRGNSVPDFVDEIALFPICRHRDRADAFSQALLYLRDQGAGAIGTKKFLRAFDEELARTENLYMQLLRYRDPRFSDPW